ncbi:DUF962 domain-containing protein [Acinetobacter wanghuae]|uniref:DUF962 domain-containing protein n=1 Tax=Acinetobacter wanghuae TaxID=2662362 RepID=A0A5Q0P2N0_9GAMM|nr:Mpo1-like protein [Acinetobacter wanghuae]MQW91100.1 DUF962 domain-containing protein [Acinetobacter wanghuae]QGA11355.1 DUF962 domain-containing protein [Acinetobacter wanghuae]
MTKIERLLSQYAAYHLDRTNVMTHFIGIPMIVFSIICLTARAGVVFSGYEVTLAMLILTLTILYYLSLDWIFAVIMAVIFLVAYPFAHDIAQWGTAAWLSTSIGIFVVGWVFQFVGHFYEKKKPAFTDDLIGLAIGPLFVLAELVFLFGFRKPLEEKILIAARQQREEMDQKNHLNEAVVK